MQRHGYPDWQRVTEWQEQVGTFDNVVQNANHTSAIFDAAGFAGVYIFFQNTSQDSRLTLQWFRDSVGADVLVQRSFEVKKNSVLPLFSPHFGPFWRYLVQVTGGAGANNFTLWRQQQIRNFGMSVVRQFGVLLATGDFSLGAGASRDDEFSGPHLGPAYVQFETTAANAVVRILGVGINASEQRLATLNAGSNVQPPHRLLYLPGLRIVARSTNNDGAAQTFNISATAHML